MGQYYPLKPLAVMYSSHHVYFSNVGLYFFLFYHKWWGVTRSIQFLDLLKTVDDHFSEGVCGSILVDINSSCLTGKFWPLIWEVMTVMIWRVLCIGSRSDGCDSTIFSLHMDTRHDFGDLTKIRRSRLNPKDSPLWIPLRMLISSKRRSNGHS